MPRSRHPSIPLRRVRVRRTLGPRAVGRTAWGVLALAFATVLAAACAGLPTLEPGRSPGLEPFPLGQVSRCLTTEGIYLASQPSPEDLQAARRAGIRTVVNLRGRGEIEWDEGALVVSLGMAYHSVPFQRPDELTDSLLDRLRSLLRDPANRPMLLHCASANRAGAVWLAYRVADGGIAWGAALAEAHLVGLRSQALEQRVEDYLRTRGSWGGEEGGRPRTPRGRAR